ncbi:MAG TPA: glycosyltransferase family 1 protein [Anaeromyxobacteraceae bacterium]|nr:glycosyltransferase family 1 protein [Anaeromyxobacteraceae bacterium]
MSLGSARGTALRSGLPDLVCLSHLRWNFVFQRPQHLMTRFALERRVFFVEEPVESEGLPRLSLRRVSEGVTVATPHLPAGIPDPEAIQRDLLDALLAEHAVARPVLWYYTPMALGYSRHVAASTVVYDCMDELSAFANAPPALLDRERELFGRAHVVFTGGHTLYEAKRGHHRNVHPFPSSVDVAFFARARNGLAEPADQAALPRPRLGFFGVVDERMDRELLAAVARSRPDWQLVVIGPVVKIPPSSLPHAPNLHWLGQRPYEALPAYVGGWDVALMPFALNEATRFISPTKTPEYLAAGRPVVSTPIRDVVRPYGERSLVRIADGPEAFVHAIEGALSGERREWRAEVDALLATTSWDATWRAMKRHVDDARTHPAHARPAAHADAEVAR